MRSTSAYTNNLNQSVSDGYSAQCCITLIVQVINTGAYVHTHACTVFSSVVDDERESRSPQMRRSRVHFATCCGNPSDRSQIFEERGTRFIGRGNESEAPRKSCARCVRSFVMAGALTQSARLSHFARTQRSRGVAGLNTAASFPHFPLTQLTASFIGTTPRSSSNNDSKFLKTSAKALKLSFSPYPG